MRKLLKKKVLLSNLGLALILVVGMSYLLLSIMRVNPLRGTYDVTVNMDRSGGLLVNNDVNYRGYRVGKVKSIKLTEKGLAAVAEINSSAKIPKDSKVAIHALSAAGEQYIDFLPNTDNSPYLDNGTVINSNDVTTPVPISDVLDNSSNLINQIDPDKLDVVLNELDKALGGKDSLRDVVSSLSVVMAGLDAQLPQTTSLISNLQIIAGTTSQIQPDLGTLTHNSGVIFDQLKAADQEVRKFLDLGPGQLATLGGVVHDTADPMTNLLTNFRAIAGSAKLRTPALRQLFPSLSTGMAALGVPAHDNMFHSVLGILPTPWCQYPTVPKDPTKVATDTTVRRFNYCVTDRPELQVRGSANAPRPPSNENWNAPPPGVDPNARTAPLPAG